MAEPPRRNYDRIFRRERIERYLVLDDQFHPGSIEADRSGSHWHTLLTCRDGISRGCYVLRDGDTLRDRFTDLRALHLVLCACTRVTSSLELETREEGTDLHPVQAWVYRTAALNHLFDLQCPYASYFILG